jgi:ABC-type transporter lipoprotein component MlaA
MVECAEELQPYLGVEIMGLVARVVTVAVPHNKASRWRWRIRAGRACIVLLLAVGVSVPTAAQEARGPSRVEVLGVDQFDTPRHRRSFQMVQYMPDPIEGFNRGSLAVTRPILHWVLRPLAKGYRAVFPEGVRRSIDRFGYNLAWPNRFVALLLQGRPIATVKETGHFLVNTTAGIGGLFDPASAIGIPTHREDVGLSFASWGAGPGFYFFIPLMGPSSGRDALGRIFDTALNPATYVPGLGWLLNANAFSFRVDTYEALIASNRELYEPIRAIWSIQREVAVERLSLSKEDYARSDPEPSLGVLLLQTDPAFLRKQRVRQVVTPATGRSLPYSVWIQQEPSSLVFIVPGIGAHRSSKLPVFLAQQAFARGYSVAVVSNPFHFEFIQSGLSVPYPGYTPNDAEDLYVALSAIDADLGREYPGRLTSKRLLGYSLGAIESLFIAGAQDSRPPEALRFERVVAINPPVDLQHAARQFDGYFDAPLRWPDEERDERVKRTGMKVYLMTQPDVTLQEGFPFDRTESEFLVGFYARVGLIEALAAIKAQGARTLEIKPEKDARGRVLLGRINQTTLERYANELIIPFYRERTGLDREALAAQAGLHAQEELLRGSERVHVLTNADDFILGQESLAWLRATAGERLTVFPRGGHLGNLHVEAVRERVFEALDGRRSRAGAAKTTP